MTETDRAIAPTGLDDVDVVSNDVYVHGVPHEQFARLRAEAPVFRQRVPDPDLADEVWVVTSARHLAEVELDPGTFSSARRGVMLRSRTFGEGTRLQSGNFLMLDGPEHRRLRRAVAAGFTPKVMRLFTEHYADLAARVLDRAFAHREFDLVTEVAAELPLLAICELLGVPEQDRSRILGWSNAVLGFDDPEYGGRFVDAGRAVVALGRYTLALAEQRRAQPSDDLFSQLVTAPADRRLGDEELMSLALLLISAGNETTRNNIAHGILALMEHPDQWDALGARPDELLDPAVEEITRWASPINYMARTATRPTELGGQPVAEGDRVALFYGSANRDETEFPDGNRFDIHHVYRGHYAFGTGPHFCLGAHLARLETRTVLAGVLARVARIRPAGPPVRLRSSFVNGIKHLPVEVTAR